MRDKVILDMQQTAKKTTLVPVYHAAWDLPKDTRVQLREDISFENVGTLLKPDNLELWRQYVSEDARKKIAEVNFALIHRFWSAEHIGPEEQKSVELMQKVFICLRVIKPTRSPWSNVQFKETPEGIDVFSFAPPAELMATTPEAEAFNQVHLADIQRLQRLLDVFLETADNGPANVKRAIRHYELGYSEVHDPVLQFVSWMMALEQLYSSGENPVPRKTLIHKISESVNLDQDILAETQFRDVYPNLPAITARETLPDLFVLRNRFVHGLWIQKEWLEPTRNGTLSGQSSYADVLREVASWLVRESLIHYLEVTSRAKA
jgi:hypothetical protein